MKVAYVCLKSHRVFRVVTWADYFCPAKLEDVVTIRDTKGDLDLLENPCWKWKVGFHTAQAPANGEEIDRLRLLNDRCQALETLYMNVSAMRKQMTKNILLNEQAESLLYQEATDYLEKNPRPEGRLLKQFSRSHKLDLEGAARLAVLMEEEKRTCVINTECFKIEWETRFIESADPLKELEVLKNSFELIF